MTSATEPMTELDAVNRLLDAIGQVAISSLSATATNALAERALKQLRDTSRSVQKRGWHWNISKNYPLSPAPGTGYVELPLNALKVDTVTTSKQVDVVQRGQRLYDRVNHTYAFDGPLVVDLVEALEWEDLPVSAQWYITVKAARRFATTTLASDTALKFTQNDEAEALIDLEADEAENDDRTMAQASPHVARMRRR